MPHKTAPWKKILFKTSVWLVSEIVLNAVGTDTLADYGEFVFDMQPCLQMVSTGSRLLIGTQYQSTTSFETLQTTTRGIASPKSCRV